MITEDELYAKIYAEFQTLRNLGLSRRDLISYIEAKNKKAEVNRMISFLQGVKQFLKFALQVKSLAQISVIQDFNQYIDKQIVVADRQKTIIYNLQQDSKECIK